MRYDQSDIRDASDSRFTYEGHSGETFTNSLGMTFVYIEPGTFMMGSPSDEPGRGGDEFLDTLKEKLVSPLKKQIFS
ncbi:MAG: hypothetical protein OMM_12754 [Candidatus Magnetoglobus multicellularis str. Araruama]|uniref:Sulfatase-modifying factor enzyme domain-containing protein n=1 Tax=Candidatus Magnetoglobus multicellularis str. Araruama TaxID=890399 RepID=A0A1V1NV94_9BACT|nr:MAG: hypothetical protein OMM_12754 [Candidatus Magnetoglobus multicellularis str. Araruama]